MHAVWLLQTTWTMVMRSVVLLVALVGCAEDNGGSLDDQCYSSQHVFFHEAGTYSSFFGSPLAAGGTARVWLVCDGGTRFYGTADYNYLFDIRSDPPDIVSVAPEPHGLTIHGVADGTATIRIYEQGTANNIGSQQVTVKTIDHLSMRYEYTHYAYADLLAADGTKLRDTDSILTLPPGATPYIGNDSFDYANVAAGNYTVTRESGGTAYEALFVAP